MDYGATLPGEFYLSDTTVVARSLLGHVLIHDTEDGRAAGVIVETEAYLGKTDAACHTFGMDSPRPGHRTEAMFMEGGHAYVYLIYGMYCCFNVVTGREGVAEAVLVRALEPVEGLDLMAARRGITPGKNYERKLCSGPGKLCRALNITRAENGLDLTSSPLRIAAGVPVPDGRVAVTPRINVAYAGDDAFLPYRFVVKDSPFLSCKPPMYRIGGSDF